MAILTIIKANLKSKKSNFISIFVLIFILSLALSTVLSVSEGNNKSVNEALDRVGAPEVCTFVIKKKLTNEMIQKAEQCKEVDQIMLNDGLTINSDCFVIKGKKATSGVILSKYEQEKGDYYAFKKDLKQLEENPIDKPQKGEIYLPVCMKDMFNCELGDKVKVTTAQGIKELTIKKFFEEPIMGSSVMGIKYTLISDEDYQENYQDIYQDIEEGNIVPCETVKIYLKDSYKNKIEDAKSSINNASKIMSAGYISLTKSQTISYTMMFIQILTGILAALALLLVLIVMIITGHSISNSIDMDYETFGILKSEGFTSSQLRLALVLQYGITAFAACVVGVLVSLLVIPSVNFVFLFAVGVETKNVLAYSSVILILLAIIVVISIYAMIKCRRITKISPIQAISKGNGPVFFASRFDFAVNNNFPLPLGGKLVLKQILSNWKQYLSTVIMVALLVFFTITVTSIKQVSNAENSSKIFGGVYTDIGVEYGKDEALRDRVADAIEQMNPIKKTVYLQNYYGFLEDKELMFRVVKDTKALNEPLKGRWPKYDNEVMITGIVEQEYDLHVGDKVKLKANEKSEEYVITGVNQDSSDAGISITLLEKGMKRLVADFHYEDVEYTIEDSDHTAKYITKLEKQFKKEIDAKQLVLTNANKEGAESVAQIMVAIDSITGITYVLVFFFGAVITFMLCHKRFVREQEDIGIYKSMGFTASCLRRQFVIRYVIVAFIGGGAGIVLNLCFNNALLSAVFRSMGIVKYVTEYNFSLLFIPLVFVLCCVLIFSFLVAGKIKRVSCKNSISE